MIFSERLFKAISFAAAAHGSQQRKVSKVPYIIHPLAVGMLLQRAGFEEDVVITGLLHDVIEDTQVSLGAVRKEFGDYVAELVEALTDPPGLVYRALKAAQYERYLYAAPEVKAIKAADMLYNMYDKMSTICEGMDPWSILQQTKEDAVWGYHYILKALRNGWEHPLLDEIDVYLKQLE